MSSCKQHFVATFCGIMLLVKPAFAFWPVFDFMEIIPVTSQVSTAAEAFVQIKSQLMQLSETLNALAAKGGTIAQFSKKIVRHSNSVGDQSSSTSDTVSQNLTTNSETQDKLDQITDTVIDGQKVLVTQTVVQIDDILNHEILPLKKRNAQNRNDIPLSIEEEEEEEEISEQQAMKEDVQEMIKNIKEDSAELTMQLNDAYEEVISMMNKNAQENHQELSALARNVESLTNVDLEQKRQIKTKLDELIVREQKVSNWGISIAEAERDKYNKEYKSKVQEGLNNYQRVVLAYIDGYSTKEDVVKAGNILKNDAEKINVKPDEMIINQYKKEISTVKTEIENIADEVKILLNTSEDTKA